MIIRDGPTTMNWSYVRCWRILEEAAAAEAAAAATKEGKGGANGRDR